MQSGAAGRPPGAYMAALLAHLLLCRVCGSVLTTCLSVNPFCRPARHLLVGHARQGPAGVPGRLQPPPPQAVRVRCMGQWCGGLSGGASKPRLSSGGDCVWMPCCLLCLTTLGLAHWHNHLQASLPLGRPAAQVWRRCGGAVSPLLLPLLPCCSRHSRCHLKLARHPPLLMEPAMGMPALFSASLRFANSPSPSNCPPSAARCAWQTRSPRSRRRLPPMWPSRCSGSRWTVWASPHSATTLGRSTPSRGAPGHIVSAAAAAGAASCC